MTTLDAVLDGRVPDWELGDERLDLAAQRRRIRQARLRRTARKLTGVLILLVVWEIGALIVADSTILPSVQTTAHTFFHYLNRPYPSASDPLWKDVVVSGRRILEGFLIAVAAGVLIGAVMWNWRSLGDMIDPVIELTRPLPPLAFIPLLIVWFGVGELPKIVLIIIAVLPIMIVSTVAALDAVPPELEQCARTLGASRLYTLLHVQIRAAMPGIITGMRLSMGGAWTSIVAVEMIAATNGVGFLILQAGNYLLTSLVMSGIIAIGIVGLTFDALLRGLLRLADPSRAVAE
ncbi:MAG: ABC transporter permease [Solirubrobacteraceae bacterium]|jgi:NitT/TauT family transport system permease protein/taurine transport system permease protein